MKFKKYSLQGLALLVCLALQMIVPGQSWAETFEEMRTTYVNLMRESRYIEARALALGWYDENTTDEYAPRALAGAASCLFHLGDYDGFKKELATIRTNYPDFVNLANLEFLEVQIAFKESDMASAEVMLKKYITRYPDKAQAAGAYYYLGTAQMIRGNTSEAVNTFAEGINKYPDSDYRTGTEFYLLKCLKELGRIKEFNKAASQFLVNHVNDDKALYHTQQVKLMQMEIAVAEQQWSNVLVLTNEIENLGTTDIDMAYLQYYRGVSWFLLGAYESAMPLLDDVIENYPESGYSPGAILYAMRACIETGDYSPIPSLYDACMQKENSEAFTAQIKDLYANAAYRQGHWEDAEARYSELLSNYGALIDRANAYYYLARIMHERKLADSF